MEKTLRFGVICGVFAALTAVLMWRLGVVSPLLALGVGIPAGTLLGWVFADPMGVLRAIPPALRATGRHFGKDLRWEVIRLIVPDACRHALFFGMLGSYFVLFPFFLGTSFDAFEPGWKGSDVFIVYGFGLLLGSAIGSVVVMLIAFMAWVCGSLTSFYVVQNRPFTSGYRSLLRMTPPYVCYYLLYGISLAMVAVMEHGPAAIKAACFFIRAVYIFAHTEIRTMAAIDVPAGGLAGYLLGNSMLEAAVIGAVAGAAFGLVNLYFITPRLVLASARTRVV